MLLVHVSIEIIIKAEGFAAFITFKRVFASMYSLVSLQLCFAGETVVALITPKRSPVAMYSYSMTIQAPFGDELIIADITYERPL